MTHSIKDEPGRLEALLPWYAKGNLSTADMRQVESYLATDAEARRMLALIEEELDATIAANEALGMPGAASRDRLMAAIAAEATAEASGTPTLWQRAKAMWASMVPEGLSPGYALGGAAAGLVILIQAAAIATMLAGQGASPGTPKLASGDTQRAAPGTFLLVRFTSDAKVADIAALLKSRGAQIVEGPKQGGVFKLRVADKVLNEEERAAIIAQLRQRSDIVSSVLPSG